MIRRMLAWLSALLLCISFAPARAEAGEAAVAAWVDGAPVYESLVKARLSSVGSPAGSLSEAEQAQRRAEILSALILEQVCLNETENRGIRLEGEVQAEADARYARTIASVEDYVRKSYPTLKGDALDGIVDEMLKNTGASREQLRESAGRSALLDALDAVLLEELPAPDDAEIQARYDALHAEQVARFDESENAFEAALLQNEIVVYRPVDLKLIQKAEFTFEKLAQSLIASAMEDDPDEAAGMMLDQYRMLADRVEEVYGALLDGERTFADVLEELEPGSSKRVNYFHPSSTRFDEDYYSRADAFTEVGEISTVYVMRNGFAMLHYAGDLPACEAVPIDEVRDRIAEALRKEQSASFLAERKQALLGAAEIEYPEASE